MEKQKAEQKAIRVIITANGSALIDKGDIEAHIRNFYEDTIFGPKVTHTHTQIRMIENIQTSIKPIQQTILNHPITRDEIDAEMKRLPKDKSPGADGFTFEFYTAHKDTLIDYLYDLFTLCYDQREITTEMGSCIVTLLPKSEDLSRIKNWRPISLLTCHYKILAAILAKRIKLSYHNSYTPTRAYVMVMCIEPLLCALRRNNMYKGISITVDHTTKNYRSKAFADDTGCFARGHSDISAIISTLRDYEKASAAKINFKKTELIPISPNAANIESIEGITVLRPATEIRYLGVQIGCHVDNHSKWMAIYWKTSQTITRWSHHHLSIRGVRLVNDTSASHQCDTNTHTLKSQLN